MANKNLKLLERMLSENALRTILKGLEPFVGEKGTRAKKQLKKAAQKALKWLEDVLPEYLDILPESLCFGYCVEYDYIVRKSFYRFYVDMPFSITRQRRSLED